MRPDRKPAPVAESSQVCQFSLFTECRAREAAAVLSPAPDSLLFEAAPAKVNLYLAVHGRRSDGFHDLTSLVVQTAWGDTLEAAESAEEGLSVSGEWAPATPDNLVLRASALFREKTGTATRYHFRLTKRIPAGSGLGGGSSNAMAALRILNRRAGHPLTAGDLAALGARLGSDCPLFVDNRPKWISGRGERIKDAGALPRELLTRSLAILRPDFPISTAEAYAGFRSQPEAYRSTVVAAGDRQRWSEATDFSPSLLYNSFEMVVGRRHLAIGAMVDTLREAGWPALLSGSGSAVFALLPSDPDPLPQLQEMVSKMLGPNGFVVVTKLIG